MAIRPLKLPPVQYKSDSSTLIPKCLPHLTRQLSDTSDSQRVGLTSVAGDKQRASQRLKLPVESDRLQQGGNNVLQDATSMEELSSNVARPASYESNNNNDESKQSEQSNRHSNKRKAEKEKEVPKLETIPIVPLSSSTSSSQARVKSDSGLEQPPLPNMKILPDDPCICPVVPGRQCIIEINKGKAGLGLSIVGGVDTLLGVIIVHEVYEDGAAANDRRVWAGDQIIEVNGESLKNATHDRAILLLRQAATSVRLTIFRDERLLKDANIRDVFTVDLVKKPGRGLGLSIVGKRNNLGVFIADVVKGGAVEADGKLMQGDQILAVNGEDLRTATQAYAAELLKTSMGKIALTVGRMMPATGPQGFTTAQASSAAGIRDYGKKSSSSGNGASSTTTNKGKRSRLFGTKEDSTAKSNITLVSFKSSSSIPSSKSY